MRFVLILAFGLISHSVSAQSTYVTSVTTAQPASTHVSMFARPQAATAPVASAPQAVAEPNAVLAQGTPVHFKTQQELNSKHSRVGDRFELRVSEDVIVNGVTVIPAGTRGVGEVTRVDGKGMFGKSGKLDARVLYARVASTT